MPGGALDADRRPARSTASSGSSRCTATRRVDVGQVGLREGPITGAADRLDVRLSRPRRAHRPVRTSPRTSPSPSGKLVTELPAVLSRRLDPRAGVSVVWGTVRAGAAPNVIPGAGRARRHRADARRRRLGRGRDLVRAADRRDRRAVRRDRGRRLHARRAAGGQRAACPPRSCARRRRAGRSGRGGTSSTTQSLGGEDFAWYLERSPARWRGSAPARRAARRTTSTRATCASTSAPSAIGVAGARRGRPLEQPWSPTGNRPGNASPCCVPAARLDRLG